MPEAHKTLDQICFVIAPIGRDGTEEHKENREILDFIIKPAVEEGDLSLHILRADDIERSGSFIKDILEYLSGARVVIADLTGQNPNVFYELGVRHSLVPRTILISRSLNDIPSDLREYRTIIYDTSAKGAAQFRTKLKAFLRDIANEPDRPDNPVLDRIGSVRNREKLELESQVAQLRAQLEGILKKGLAQPKKAAFHKSEVNRRMYRILTLLNAAVQVGSGTLTYTSGGKSITCDIPTHEGDFQLYYVMKGDSVAGIWYVSTQSEKVDIEKQLADARVLMHACSQGDGIPSTFFVVTEEDLSESKAEIVQAFRSIRRHVAAKYRKGFLLELWDRDTLIAKEIELGIRATDPEDNNRK